MRGPRTGSTMASLSSALPISAALPVRMPATSEPPMAQLLITCKGVGGKAMRDEARVRGHLARPVFGGGGARRRRLGAATTSDSNSNHSWSALPGRRPFRSPHPTPQPPAPPSGPQAALPCADLLHGNLLGQHGAHLGGGRLKPRVDQHKPQVPRKGQLLQV